MTKSKQPETRYEVYWTQHHHGEYVPDRPWCAILRSKPGTPGEPTNGIRIMRSFETRDEVISYVAKELSYSDRRVARARAKMELLQSQVLLEIIADLSATAPTGPGDPL